jgi:CheY-like chemotaxis protein
MPVKILLADKSITIQKVVEMLFSGRDYEVTCASDGEAAYSEAARIVPDVVLADVGLPLLDGYGLAARLRQNPPLTDTPVIMMMSKDDVYDPEKGAQAGIVDSITKPFESQELIGKVKKALSAATPRPAGPERPAAAKPAEPAIRPAAADRPPAAPSDIFDIIQEAPAMSELSQEKAASPPEDELVFEVEPEVEEVEEPVAPDTVRALPVGDRAVEEMRAGLGLESAPEPEVEQPELVSFDSFEEVIDEGPGKNAEPAPKTAKEQAEPVSFDSFEEVIDEGPKKESRPEPAESGPLTQSAAAKVLSALPASELRKLAEDTIAKVAQEVYAKMPPPPLPKVTDDTVRRGIEVAVSKVAREIGREVIERVAWEVIPPLAEQLIKEEIEKLKALQ